MTTKNLFDSVYNKVLINLSEDSNHDMLVQSASSVNDLAKLPDEAKKAILNVITQTDQNKQSSQQTNPPYNSTPQTSTQTPNTSASSTQTYGSTPRV